MDLASDTSTLLTRRHINNRTHSKAFQKMGVLDLEYTWVSHFRRNQIILKGCEHTKTADKVHYVYLLSGVSDMHKIMMTKRLDGMRMQPLVTSWCKPLGKVENSENDLRIRLVAQAFSHSKLVDSNLLARFELCAQERNDYRIILPSDRFSTSRKIFFQWIF